MELSSFFGLQEQRKGVELVRKDQVVISSASDTDVRAFVKGSSACRVSLTADAVAAAACSANCTCPQARKGELCKHIWAVMIKLSESGADFLEGKSEIRTAEVAASAAELTRKAKQAEFKKEQQQRVKDRNKEIRLQKKSRERGPRFQYPEPVQESLDYFSANETPLDNLDMASLINARKVLSRVYHPDKGGSHQEILELNEHFAVLEAYLKS